ncbi:hypothetical protein ACHAPT_013128 [Fusarium lateritium]
MRSVLWLATASLAAATSLPFSWTGLNPYGIKWHRCSNELPPNIECGQIQVPLDYSNPQSFDTLALDVLRFQARKKPLKGSIIINFGKLGVRNIPELANSARRFLRATGGHYDLVTWNIRGTGRSIPFDCSTPFVPGEARRPQPPRRGQFDVHNATSWRRKWDESAELAENCYFQFNGTGELFGMAFHARDMIQLVEALKEDGMLRYWGLSTGAVLGATTAAMFPDRVDKVLLDGVRNVHEYYHVHGDPTIFDNLDKTFHAFLKGCVAAPHNCALARGYRTVDDIKFLIRELYKELKANPRKVNGVTFDLPHFQGYLLRSLYYPKNYTILAKSLDRLVSGDMEPLEDFEKDGQKYLRTTDVAFGIRCGDLTQRVSSIEELEPTIEALRRKTEWFPYIAEGRQTATCAQWPFRAKEVYDGSFNVTTRNPVLIIGNVYDPATPWEGAKNLSKSFNNAGTLRYKGFGHTTTAQNSDCVWDVINKYFTDGDVPPPDAWCEPNEPIFSNTTEWSRMFGPEARASIERLWQSREKLGYCDLY